MASGHDDGDIQSSQVVVFTSHPRIESSPWQYSSRHELFIYTTNPK
jgi:hypothetical protein